MLNDDNTSNPKRFWRFIKGKRTESTRSSTSTIESILHGDTTTNTNILNNQFTSVFLSEQGGDIQVHVPTGKTTIFICTRHNSSPSWSLQLLHNTHQHKAIDPAIIPGKLLKELASEVSPILTIIYNASIKQCKIPSQWKEQANGKMH
jgi:tRNA pseudouridine-54 N-methylase